MKPVKEFFKGWNLFEKAYLLAVLVLPAAFTIGFKSTIVGCLSTTLYLFWCLLLAKGKSYAHVIGIFAVFLYAYVSYTVKYYGEVIITFAVMLPLIVFGLISWLRNKRYDEKEGSVVIVANVSKKEMLLAALSQIVMGAGYYYLLKAFDTAFLIVSTFSIMTSVFATFLIARRNQYAFWAYILNDVVLIILWGYLVFTGNPDYAPILLMPVMLLINDIYGMINWERLKNTQESN